MRLCRGCAGATAVAARAADRAAQGGVCRFGASQGVTLFALRYVALLAFVPRG